MKHKEWDEIIQRCADDYNLLKKNGRNDLIPRNFIRAWMQTNYNIFKLSGYFYRMFNTYIESNKFNYSNDISEGVDQLNQTSKKDIKNETHPYLQYLMDTFIENLKMENDFLILNLHSIKIGFKKNDLDNLIIADNPNIFDDFKDDKWDEFYLIHGFHLCNNKTIQIEYYHYNWSLYRQECYYDGNSYHESHNHALQNPKKYYLNLWNDDEKIKLIKYLIDRGIIDEIEGLNEGVDQINHVSNKTLKKQSFDAIDKYVDLGLTSGTLWCKCNLGAEKPEDYGNYYRFDEWDKDLPKHLTVPTKEQLEELKNETEHEIAEVNGIKGMKFIGSNGNSIFVPFAGNRTGFNLRDLNSPDEDFSLWSSQFNWCLDYEGSEKLLIVVRAYERCGLSIRLVLKKQINEGAGTQINQTTQNSLNKQSEKKTDRTYTESLLKNGDIYEFAESVQNILNVMKTRCEKESQNQWSWGGGHSRVSKHKYKFRNELRYEDKLDVWWRINYNVDRFDRRRGKEIWYTGYIDTKLTNDINHKNQICVVMDIVHPFSVYNSPSSTPKVETYFLAYMPGGSSQWGNYRFVTDGTYPKPRFEMNEKTLKILVEVFSAIFYSGQHICPLLKEWTIKYTPDNIRYEINKVMKNCIDETWINESVQHQLYNTTKDDIQEKIEYPDFSNKKKKLNETVGTQISNTSKHDVVSKSDISAEEIIINFLNNGGEFEPFEYVKSEDAFDDDDGDYCEDLYFPHLTTIISTVNGDVVSKEEMDSESTCNAAVYTIWMLKDMDDNYKITSTNLFVDLVEFQHYDDDLVYIPTSINELHKISLKRIKEVQPDFYNEIIQWCLQNMKMNEGAEQINQVSDKTLKKQSFDAIDEYVDLGLESGTLWCKCNLGANRPEEYGDYYQFGVGYEDLPEYLDIPTKEQLEELEENTEHICTELNGIKGMKFIGPNGNSIFIPFAGYRTRIDLRLTDKDFTLWSSQFSWCLDYNSKSEYLEVRKENERCGFSVRPVFRSVR